MKNRFYYLSLFTFFTLFFVFLISTMIIKTPKTNTLISNYHEVFIPGYDELGKLTIAIRSYSINNTEYFLIVNPNTLETKYVNANSIKIEKSNKLISQKLAKTPFILALQKYTAAPYYLSNYGLTQSDHYINGKFLTIDMCPSHKPFEKDFFNMLVKMSELNHKAIPISLSMSGLWMLHHTEEFDWLIKQKKENKLNITWINHSFSHPYYKNLPNESNFLLMKDIDFTHEILDTEKILLEKGETPSVFFRFPGLISNEKLILKLREFSLIPVGANAWLAKGEKIHNGSIILVHGNSNEHKGIELIEKTLQNNGAKDLLKLDLAINIPLITLDITKWLITMKHSF
jgi:hypothetical protein